VLDVELVYCPVMSGISWVTFTSDPRCFMVMNRGMEMMYSCCRSAMLEDRQTPCRWSSIGAGDEGGTVGNRRGQAVADVDVLDVVVVVALLVPNRDRARQRGDAGTLVRENLVTP